MSEGKFALTPEQEAAVTYRGGALLVSAAAGSGKTKVLVERLLDMVENGDDVDEFLIITYTRASALELRARINDELLDRLAANPGNRRLRRQSILCRDASISTIHSYCADILRENTHLSELSSDFRVMEESESELIKTAVLDDVLNEAYESIETSGDLRSLIDTIATGRDDRRLAAMIIDAHRKLQSNPNPRSWLEEQAAKQATPDISDLSETEWGGYLIERTKRKATYWRDAAARLLEDMGEYPDFAAAYGQSVGESIADCDEFLQALDISWEEACRYRKIRFSRPKPISGYDDFKKTRSKCKAELEKCSALLVCGSDEHLDDMRASAPAIAALVKLILDFDKAYSHEKRNKGVVDFSDLEHLTLSLLVNSETGAKTEFASAVSRRYKEIMIDEYQDVNAIQESIFQALSKDGKNLFMVGDVKQSIYRFRLADPSIFLSKYNSAVKENSEFGMRDSELAVMLLSKNFRSREGILNFTNFLFERIMSVDFGGMEYSERERLVPGRVNGPSKDPAVELDFIDMSETGNDEGEESPNKTQMEARFIARRILELTSGAFRIPDGQGGERRVEFSDIVILLRSMRNKAWRYAGALAECGIPADMPGGEGYFETIEISSALSILSVVDNPMQDIPLAAALRSPVFGFTADELAGIRAGSKDTDFYRALSKAATSDAKCAAFLADMDAMRLLAPDMTAASFIWHMYNKTGLLGLVGAMQGGARRRDNLILLVEYARSFERNGYKGLFGFLTYVRSIQEKGEDLSRGQTEGPNNAVRIMSIHKSKGLEYPVVFIADTSKRFNFSDTYEPLVMHPELGLGIKRIDRRRRIEYPTIARLAIQNKLTAETLAEELRVLYVAMTRAREKLIITATGKREIRNYIPGEERGKRKEESDDLGAQLVSERSGIVRAPAQELEDMRSPVEWILAAITANSKFGIQNSEFDIRYFDTEENAEIWNSEFGSRNYGQAEEREKRKEESGEGIRNSEFGIRNYNDRGEISAFVEVLNERFSFVYPYLCSPELPSKLTVTELKGRYIDNGDGDAEIAGYAKLRDRERLSAYNRPGFITQQEGLTAAERGTALHLAMQYIDFKNCVGAGGVCGELRLLVEKGILSKEQEAAVDAQKVTRFFESEIGRRVIKAEKISREFRFSLLYPAERFYRGGGEDQVLLQGIIDCFFEEDDDIVVIDFKTDNVTKETLRDKVNDYSPQLSLYADALQRITGKHIKERIIYFFAMDCAIEVE